MWLRILTTVLVSLTVTSTVVAQEDGPFRAAGDRPTDIEHIRLDLTVDIPKKTAGGKATIDLVALRDTRSIRFDAVAVVWPEHGKPQVKHFISAFDAPF